MTIRDDGKIEWTDSLDDSPAANPMLTISDNTVLAMSGEVYDHMMKNDPEFAVELANHVSVFGRCNPNQKVSVVSTFVKKGEITLMW
jgi:magnesium-transporting ATPase (P-type)